MSDVTKMGNTELVDAFYKESEGMGRVIADMLEEGEGSQMAGYDPEDSLLRNELLRRLPSDRPSIKSEDVLQRQGQNKWPYRCTWPCPRSSSEPHEHVIVDGSAPEMFYHTASGTAMCVDQCGTAFYTGTTLTKRCSLLKDHSGPCNMQPIPGSVSGERNAPHTHTKDCYRCGHEDCPCVGGWLHETPLCGKAEPVVYGEGGEPQSFNVFSKETNCLLIGLILAKSPAEAVATAAREFASYVTPPDTSGMYAVAAQGQTPDAAACEMCDKGTHPLIWHKGVLVHHKFGKSGYYPCERLRGGSPARSGTEDSLDANRMRELCLAHEITDTDILKHTLEDHDRWHADIISGRLIEPARSGEAQIEQIADEITNLVLIDEGWTQLKIEAILRAALGSLSTQPEMTVIEAARCIHHWHDWGKDNEGMVVSSEHVRKLWEALGEYDKALSGSLPSPAPTIEHKWTIHTEDEDGWKCGAGPSPEGAKP